MSCVESVGLFGRVKLEALVVTVPHAVDKYSHIREFFTAALLLLSPLAQ